VPFPRSSAEVAGAVPSAGASNASGTPGRGVFWIENTLRFGDCIPAAAAASGDRDIAGYHRARLRAPYDDLATMSETGGFF
jgi:hypothetical protein